MKPLILFVLFLPLAAFAAKPPPIHVEGRQLVDRDGYTVRLRGAMRSIHPYFDGGRWGGGDDEDAAKRAREYYDRTLAGLVDHSQGAYVNLMRFTDDGHWSNDDRLKPDKKSPHFYACDWKRYDFYVNEVLVPIVENAVEKGMYVIIRPSYNNPGETKVGDDFNRHLQREWSVIAANERIQALSGQILFELQNEPTTIFAADGTRASSAMAEFFQSVVDVIRKAGFKGVVLVPGMGYQSSYGDYAFYPVHDDNMGYAVHVYEGWYGQKESSATVEGFMRNFRRQVPVVDRAPIVVTEVDWSPEKPGAGKTNEFGKYVPANWGTWATASTASWGKAYLGMIERFGNISTICGDSHLYYDIDEYLKSGKFKVKFDGNPECSPKAFYDLYNRWYHEPRRKPAREAIPAATTYRNPVIFADCPDVGLCSDGKYYYMVSTTMHLMPGAPIMKSKDLVHWKTVAYAIDRFDEKPDFSLEDGKSAYAGGQWASSLRYHDGKFYLWFIANGCGGFLYTAPKAEGPWKLETRGPFLHDGSVLFDDDGKILVFHGNGWVTELKDDFSAPKPGGVNHRLFERGEEIRLLEGSAAFKKDGYYYLMMVSCFLENHPRREVCYRSKTLDGPWEKKVILETRFDNHGGVGQGCVVEGPDGKWHALVFQDRGGVGRTPCLMDVRWEDGWPMLGNPDGTVPSDVSRPYPDLSGIVASDEFAEDELPLVWQFNHNPVLSAVTLSERKGWLTLATADTAPNLFLAKNTLTQRMIGPECSAVVKLDVSRMKDGDHAGIAAFQGDSAVAEVIREGRNFKVRISRESVFFRHGDGRKDFDRVEEEIFSETNFPGREIYFTVHANFREWQDWAEVAWSTDGERWRGWSKRVPLRFDTGKFFMGTKFALFNYATKAPGGKAQFDFFRVRATEHEPPRTAGPRPAPKMNAAAVGKRTPVKTPAKTTVNKSPPAKTPPAKTPTVKTPAREEPAAVGTKSVVWKNLNPKRFHGKPGWDIHFRGGENSLKGKPVFIAVADPKNGDSFPYGDVRSVMFDFKDRRFATMAVFNTPVGAREWDAYVKRFSFFDWEHLEMPFYSGPVFETESKPRRLPWFYVVSRNGELVESCGDLSQARAALEKCFDGNEGEPTWEDTVLSAYLKFWDEPANSIIRVRSIDRKCQPLVKKEPRAQQIERWAEEFPDFEKLVKLQKEAETLAKWQPEKPSDIKKREAQILLFKKKMQRFLNSKDERITSDAVRIMRMI